MTIPEWAEKDIKKKIAEAPSIRNGKTLFFIEFSHSEGGLGGMKVKVTTEEDHRPPKK